jgi:GcrA cell cycle regulator
VTNKVLELSGVLFMADEGPSFGTPVFKGEDLDAYFLQSSSDERVIENFVRLSSQQVGRRGFAVLRSNRSFVIGMPFQYGFRDADGRISVNEKFVLQEKLRDEFDKYRNRAFLAFSIARFLVDYELAVRICSIEKIRASIESGELVRPKFLDPEIASRDARPAAGGPFTPDKVELLKRLWSDGLSASQIATKLGGGITRNAVIGKVHRLNLSGRANVQDPTIPRVRPVPIDLRIRLVLGEGKCHWPIGDPMTPEFSFCSQPASNGGPYCDYHSRMAFQVSSGKINDPNS